MPCFLALASRTACIAPLPPACTASRTRDVLPVAAQTMEPLSKDWVPLFLAYAAEETKARASEVELPELHGASASRRHHPPPLLRPCRPLAAVAAVLESARAGACAWWWCWVGAQARRRRRRRPARCRAWVRAPTGPSWPSGCSSWRASRAPGACTGARALGARCPVEPSGSACHTWLTLRARCSRRCAQPSFELRVTLLADAGAYHLYCLLRPCRRRRMAFTIRSVQAATCLLPRADT